MKSRVAIISGVLLPVVFALFVAAGQASDGKVTISKPDEGELVKSSSYVVEFKLDKGLRGDHVHIFLDGKHIGPVTKKSKYKLLGLKKGPHTVTLKLADKKHSYLGPEGKVNFTVE